MQGHLKENSPLQCAKPREAVPSAATRERLKRCRSDVNPSYLPFVLRFSGEPIDQFVPYLSIHR
jgi:hypothetical protein